MHRSTLLNRASNCHSLPPYPTPLNKKKKGKQNITNSVESFVVLLMLSVAEEFFSCWSNPASISCCPRTTGSVS